MQQPKQEIKVIRKIIRKKVQASAQAPAQTLVAQAPAQTLVAQAPAVAQSPTKEELIILYIQQLTPQEKIVLKIATEHLETSFCIEKSLGFLEWHKKYLTTSS
jgi:hypothetical protein